MSLSLSLNLSLSLSLSLSTSMSISMSTNDWTINEMLPVILFWAKYLHGARAASDFELGWPAVQVQAVATTDQLAALQAQSREVYVDPSLVQYAVKLISATRTPDKHGIKDLARFITYGASPRATIGLVEILRQRENAYAVMLYAGWSFESKPEEFALAASAADTPRTAGTAKPSEQ